MRTMGAGEFKAKCLAVMDEVRRTGHPVLITKRGKPVARLISAVEDAPSKLTVESIFNNLHGLATIVGDPDAWMDPVVPEQEWDHLELDWPVASAE